MRMKVTGLLNGPRAGWIGVPILAMLEGRKYKVDTQEFWTGRIVKARAWVGGSAAPHGYEWAELPSCALMLAVLKARESTP